MAEILTKLSLDDADFKKKLSDNEKTVLKFTAAVGAISASMTAAAVYTAQWQDATVKASRAAGTTVETFSALSVAAEKSNVSTEELTKQMSKLNNITPESAKNLSAVGVSVRDSNGHLKNTETLLGDVAEQMKKMKSPADQAAVAVKVFGEEGGKLVNLLKDGKAGLEAARKEAEKYGLVVSAEAAAASEKFNDSMTDTKNALKGLVSSLGESLIAWSNQGGIMDYVRDSIASITGWWRSLSSETKDTIITIGAVVTGFAALLAAIIAINAILPTLKAGLATAFGPIGIAIALVTAGIAGFIKFLKDYAESAKAIFGPIAQAAQTAWNALKQMGAAIATIFTSSNDAELQESLKRTGKNMAETQKGASAFAKVMASLAATLSSVFQIIAGAIALVANGVETTSKQLSQFNTLVKAAFSGNSDAASKAWREMTITAYKGAQETNKIIDGLAKGLKDTWTAATNLPPPKLNYDLKKTADENKKHTSQLKEQFTALGFNITQQIGEWNDGITRFNRKILTIADGAKKVAAEVVGYMGGVNDAMKAVTSVLTSGSQYATKVALRDLEVQQIQSRKAYEAIRENAEAEENAKTAALEKSYDDQIEALKNGEAEKTAAVEFESKQRLLLNDQEYQTAKEQAEAAHAAFMEGERARFEEEKALMGEKTIDKEQRRLNEGVMDANWDAYVKAQQAALQDQLNGLAKNAGDKRTKIESDTKAKISSDAAANAEKLKALEAAKAEALKKNEEDKNKRMAEIDAARTAQEKAEEKKRLQIQYDAEVQDFEQTKAVKITDVIISGITAAANAFAALAPIPFVGWGLGVAAAAAITGATAASVAQISSQKPVKPAALIAESGGLISGPRHSQGGVDLNAEGGELILSRGRTRALFDAIDGGAGMGGGVTVNISGDVNAVALSETVLAEMIGNMVAEKVGNEVRRLGIVGA